VKKIALNIIYIFFTITLIWLIYFIDQSLIVIRHFLMGYSNFLQLIIIALIHTIFPLLTVALISFEHLKKLILNRKKNFHFIPVKFISSIIIFHILFPWFLSAITASHWYFSINSYPRFLALTLFWYNLIHCLEKQKS